MKLSKNRTVTKLLALLLGSSILLFGAVNATTGETSKITSASIYQLNAGDQIKVSVFGEEDLSMEARLTDTGTISYPFLGEIRVRGLTVGQLEALVTKELEGDYLINPRVNVTITEYRKFFVYGEVKKPGGFAFEPGLTLEKAIALAGGFSPRASKRSVEVTREFNGKKFTDDMILDKPVLPGDIVNVQESFF